MFDFERLSVYQKTESYYRSILILFSNSKIDRNTKDQLRRASLSILLNIAEGSGKYTKNDKRRFYVIAKGSAHECAAIIKVLYMETNITVETYQELYAQLTEIVRMLVGLISSMNQRKN